MENTNKTYKPTITIREIDDLYYIIISDSMRHYFLHYASKFNFLG